MKPVEETKPVGNLGAKEVSLKYECTGSIFIFLPVCSREWNVI